MRRPVGAARRPCLELRETRAALRVDEWRYNYAFLPALLPLRSTRVSTAPSILLSAVR